MGVVKLMLQAKFFIKFNATRRWIKFGLLITPTYFFELIKLCFDPVNDGSENADGEVILYSEHRPVQNVQNFGSPACIL